MKRTCIFLTFILTINFAVMSCSKDSPEVENTSTENPTEEEDPNDNENPGETTENGFSYNGTFFATEHVFVSDENTYDNTPSDISIILSSVDPFTVNESSGVNFVFFDFEAIELEATTYSEFPDYRIFENAELNNMQVTGGNIILDDTNDNFLANSHSVTIHSLSEDEIDFEFSFTRADGEIITGNFSGSYTDTSN